MFYWPIHIYNKRISGIDSTAALFKYDTLFYFWIHAQHEEKQNSMVVLQGASGKTERDVKNESGHHWNENENQK